MSFIYRKEKFVSAIIMTYTYIKQMTKQRIADFVNFEL